MVGSGHVLRAPWGPIPGPEQGRDGSLPRRSWAGGDCLAKGPRRSLSQGGRSTAVIPPMATAICCPPPQCDSRRNTPAPRPGVPAPRPRTGERTNRKAGQPVQLRTSGSLRPPHFPTRRCGGRPATWGVRILPAPLSVAAPVAPAMACPGEAATSGRSHTSPRCARRASTAAPRSERAGSRPRCRRTRS